jgi:hypothetical protein
MASASPAPYSAGVPQQDRAVDLLDVSCTDSTVCAISVSRRAAFSGSAKGWSEAYFIVAAPAGCRAGFATPANRLRFSPPQIESLTNAERQARFRDKQSDIAKSNDFVLLREANPEASRHLIGGALHG